MIAPPADSQSALESTLQSRSIGIKLLMVAVLALLITIPALFVSSLVQDRTGRAAEVTRDVSNHVGGPQTFLGPTLMIPYTIAPQYPGDQVKHGNYFVFPTQGTAALKTTTAERRRSLFKVPVFQTDAKFEAAFDLNGTPAAAPAGMTLDWALAEIVVGVSDPRGAIADATINVDGKTATLTPAVNAQSLNITPDGHPILNLQLFGVNASSFAAPGNQLKLSSTLRFSGAQQVAVLAYGKTTHVAISGDWPSPGFDGSFAPVQRSVRKNGFTAEWSVPYIARGVGAEGPENALSNLKATTMAVSFVEVADPYQSVSRSLKYVLLFVGLVFLSYFLFEVTTGKRVHPAQYVLVGVAQLIFYLLLLSLAERIGFGLGFLFAGSATVGLLSINAAWVFASVREGWRALGIFSSLYSLIYLLLGLRIMHCFWEQARASPSLQARCISRGMSIGMVPYRPPQGRGQSLPNLLERRSHRGKHAARRHHAMSRPFQCNGSDTRVEAITAANDHARQPLLARKLHVAIIMDGNGRWAVRQGLPRLQGHRAGVKAARLAVESALKAGVRCLTLYAFSADNWRRPAAEVQGIFWLLRAFLRMETERMRQRGVRVEVIGRRDRLAHKVIEAMEAAESSTSACCELHLRVAVDYSSRASIVQALTDASKTADTIHTSGLLHTRIEQFLCASEDVDLLIRTGGEKRLSDFLLWESAYAELLFLDRMWPDFDQSDFEKAIAEFRQRERRYGGVGQAPAPPVCLDMDRTASGSRER
jgi:inner membrane protein